METKEKHWTPEMIAYYKESLRNDIIKSKKIIKNCRILMIILPILALNALFLLGFTLMGILLSSLFLIIVVILYYVVDKHKTIIIFWKATLTIPDEAY